MSLLGDYEGSGYKEPPSLARRPDGQVIQLTPLLYAVADEADGARSTAEIAEVVTERIGRRVTAANVETLIGTKLVPLGVLTGPDGVGAEVKKADPMLALTFRAGLIPERASRRVATTFSWLFFPPIVLAALGGLVAADVFVFAGHGIGQATRTALYQPATFLVLFGLIVVSAALHEIGHAAACRYGGGDPGRMGCGLYLAWPAFYTDVTDAYRLSRRARLRVDLGGVYLNVIVIVATVGAFLLTGWEPLLLLVVFQHIEIIHQLLPVVRLDGYYVVADLTGVPDLFNRLGPILTSALPWKKADERVTVLKPWVRRAVTAWVCIIVPLLLFQLFTVVLHLPRIAGTAWDSAGKLAGETSKAAGQGSWLSVASNVLQIVVLALPILGIFLTLYKIASTLVRKVLAWTSGRPLARLAAAVAGVALCGMLASAWIPRRSYQPIGPNETGRIQEAQPAPARLVKLQPPISPPPTVKNTNRSGTSPSTSAPSPSTTAPPAAGAPTSSIKGTTTSASTPTSRATTGSTTAGGATATTRAATASTTATPTTSAATATTTASSTNTTVAAP